MSFEVNPEERFDSCLAADLFSEPVLGCYTRHGARAAA